MMRKRAQRRMPAEEAVKTSRPVKTIKKKTRINKKQWIAISLIGVFLMVLFLNSYFNVASEIAINPEGGTVSEKFYLSGPDPYYNMRLVNQTLETGQYPFYVSGEKDPLLNYPIGRPGGGRAPLLNMMAIGFSRLLAPFMSDTDAIGYSMQFIPALFGALIVFPVYFIGKSLFGKKEGLVGAMLIAIIPIHIGSGHGSAYGLFDHDSLNLLLFFLTFLFLIKSVTVKDSNKSLLYAILSGIPLAGLTMVWTEAQFLYVAIAVYATVQILIDIFTSKTDRNVVRNIILVLFTGYLVSLPVIMAGDGGFNPDINLFIVLGITLFGFIALVFQRFKIPWIVSLPIIFSGGGLVVAALYFINPLSKAVPFLSPLRRLSRILYGSGIYGNKVSQTIAEASTYNISRSVMSYGPVIYWLAWFGLVFLMYKFITKKRRRDFLFIIVLFFINLWLASTAGRFLNDMVPLIALLGGWITWFAVSKIDYKQMFRSIRNAGGGFRGIRKGIKVYHILGILFVALLVMMPNAFLALDAAVPGAVTKNGTSNMKIDYFGEDHSGAFGSNSYKEQYWVDAFSWLNEQDSDIKTPGDRPAFISWWDYGFYGVAVGGHPVVADNFQDGIPPASNFHTSTSEKDAVGIWIVRILQGDMSKNDGKISAEATEALEKHLGETNASTLIGWMENPESSPSYQAPIGADYDEELSKTLLVGEQYKDNAYYHDIITLFNETLDDEGVTMLYHDIQQATGLSIRYYGVEGYDEQIFDIFGFLADKSLVLQALRTGGRDRFYNPEDDFTVVKYTGYTVNPDGSRGSDATWTAGELNAMTDDELRYVAITDTTTEKKPDYYKTMFFNTYIGDVPEALQNQISQLPCWEMRHFAAEYISELPYFGSGRSAVVIAKYYEGAKINGTVEFEGSALAAQLAIRKATSLYGNSLLIDHDKINTEDGTFDLIAPAGNITLEIRRYPEMGLNAFVMKSIVFNSTNDSQLAPITDDDAMRREGSNHQRTLNITIDPATFEGFVYEDIDTNDTYNMSIDTPLSDVDVTLYEIVKTDPESGQPTEYGEFYQMTTDENGFYNVSGLMPGIYIIRAVLDDFVIHENYAFIYSGTNSYNISKPQPSGVEGSIYFDENENGEYDAGEELNTVDVDLIYTKVDGQTMIVDSMTTDATGGYMFSSLTPGQYILNATKTNSATGYLDYAIEDTVTLTENETTLHNISIDYAPIAVSGYTQHDANNIQEITIDFDPDESIENNTAEQASVISDDNGYYIAELKPGHYNISIEDIGGENKATYTYSGQLVLSMGEGIKALNLMMTKETIAVSGTATHNSQPKKNITITFSASSDVENNTNTARYASSKTAEDGEYNVELFPGTYDVEVNEEVNESGQLVTYTFTGSLEVKETDVSIVFDIALTKE